MNFVKRWRALAWAAVCALVLFGCAGESTAAGQTLVIGTVQNPPFCVWDADGQPGGVDVELAGEACRRMGVTPEFRLLEKEEAEDALRAGEVDCLWSGLSMNGRQKSFDWAGPYLHSRQVVAVRRASGIRLLGDLKDKRVAVESGSAPETLLLARASSGLSPVKSIYSLADMAQVRSAMTNGYVDACAGQEGELSVFLGDEENRYCFLERDLMTSDLGVAFFKGGGHPLREELENTLREMASDGSAREIVERYGLDGEKALEGIA